MDITPLLPGIMSLVGSAVLAGVAWILKTLSGQNRAMASQSQALAVLVTRVDPAIANVAHTQTLAVTVGQLDTRLTIVEQELRGSRVAGTSVTVN